MDFKKPIKSLSWVDSETVGIVLLVLLCLVTIFDQASRNA